jgi:molecular chaperone DnaK (HSP70)
VQVLNAESGRLTPSMVAFGAKQRFKGCIAGNNIATNPTSTINMLKRIIGRKFNDPQVQEELQNALYKFQEGPDGGILVQVNYLGEAKTYTPEQVSIAEFLKQVLVKSMLRASLRASASSDAPNMNITELRTASPRHSSPLLHSLLLTTHLSAAFRISRSGPRQP